MFGMRLAAAYLAPRSWRATRFGDYHRVPVAAALGPDPFCAVRRCSSSGDGKDLPTGDSQGADAPKGASLTGSGGGSATSHPSSTSNSSSSREGVRWLLSRRYGSPSAPYFGVFLDGDHLHGAIGNGQTPSPPPSSTSATTPSSSSSSTTSASYAAGPPVDPADELTLFRRGLYCKALLYVTGQHRRGRDWIAGWACALPGENSPLLPTILRYHATAKDVQNFAKELQSRELAHDAERMVAHTVCMDAATLVSMAGPPSSSLAASASSAFGLGAASSSPNPVDVDALTSPVELRYLELGEAVGCSRKWLGLALDAAYEERAIAWDKARVLEGGGVGGGDSDDSGR